MLLLNCLLIFSQFFKDWTASNIRLQTDIRLTLVHCIWLNVALPINPNEQRRPHVALKISVAILMYHEWNKNYDLKFWFIYSCSQIENNCVCKTDVSFCMFVRLYMYSYLRAISLHWFGIKTLQATYLFHWWYMFLICVTFFIFLR